MAEEEEDEYQQAMQALASLISSKTRSDGKNWEHAFQIMGVYLERLGLQEDLPKLSVIHVAGTKGKGSTCAMVEAILRAAGYRTGLFTSPHLCDVRERFRINGQCVDKALFLEHFWAAFRRCQQTATPEAGMPAYFRFLTLLGLRLFLAARVDVAILEVGLGGRLDATNCVPCPVVCGVAPLGYDHVELLGHTLPEIAREKAGIFKPGSPAYTVPQPEDAMAALQDRAAAVGIPLAVPPPLGSYRAAGGGPVRLGLQGEHQATNAALAVALASAWESRTATAQPFRYPEALHNVEQVAAGVLPPAYVAGLADCRWPGRAQVIHDQEFALDPAAAASGSDSNHGGAAERPSRLTFYLDGAHTPESMTTCAHWFAHAAAADAGAPTSAALGVQRLLMFNCMQERDPQKLLQPLMAQLRAGGAAPHAALFVPPDSLYYSLTPAQAGAADLAWQCRLRDTWQAGLPPPAPPQATEAPPLPPLPASAALGAAVQDVRRGAVVPSLSASLAWLRRCVREQPRLRMQVLVTGSLYLVGDMLRALGRPPC